MVRDARPPSRWRAPATATAKKIAPISRLAAGDAGDGDGVDEHVFLRGNHKTPGEPVPRRFLEALAGAGRRSRRRGSGRLELARQMTDPASNPLAAAGDGQPRLAPPVRPRDRRDRWTTSASWAKPPTHPELLDYLADRFVTRRLVGQEADPRAGPVAHLPDGSRAADEGRRGSTRRTVLLHRANAPPARRRGDPRRDAGRLRPARPQMFGPSVPVHLTPFLDGRGRPAQRPARRRRPAEHLPGRPPQLPHPVPARVRHADPVLDRRPPAGVERAGPGADPAQRPVRAPAGRGVGEDASAQPEHVRRRSGLRGCTEPPSAGPTRRRWRPASDFVPSRRLGGATDGRRKVWADLAHMLFNAKEFIFLE